MNDGKIPKALSLGSAATIGGIGGLVATTIGAAILGLVLGKETGIEHDFFKSGTGTNYPVKVRGGSMTFRHKGGWKATGTNGAYVTAASVDMSGIELIGVQPVSPATPLPSLPTAWGMINVPWGITVYGRTADGKLPSSNGIQLCMNTTTDTHGVVSCDLTTTTMGTNLTLIPLNSYSSFYNSNDAPDDSDTSGKNRGKRFNDLSCDNPPPVGHIGDRDLCEHIGQIVVTFVTNPVTTYTYICPDGECNIGMGK